MLRVAVWQSLFWRNNLCDNRNRKKRAATTRDDAAQTRYSEAGRFWYQVFAFDPALSLNCASRSKKNHRRFFCWAVAMEMPTSLLSARCSPLYAEAMRKSYGVVHQWPRIRVQALLTGSRFGSRPCGAPSRFSLSAPEISASNGRTTGAGYCQSFPPRICSRSFCLLTRCRRLRGVRHACQAVADRHLSPTCSGGGPDRALAIRVKFFSSAFSIHRTSSLVAFCDRFLLFCGWAAGLAERQICNNLPAPSSSTEQATCRFLCAG